jgi:hypothetical protein
LVHNGFVIEKDVSFQDEFISNAESSMPDAIVPSSTLAPLTSTTALHPPQSQPQPQPPPSQIFINNATTTENERRNNAAAAAATTALLNSWMVPPDLVAESSSGFAMVIDQVSTI